MSLTETAVQKLVADVEVTVAAVEKVIAEIATFKANPFNLGAVYSAVSELETVYADVKQDLADIKVL